MGKNLIIKGADFSENAIPGVITWYVNEYNQAIAVGAPIDTPANPLYAGFAPNYDFGAKVINILQFKVAQAGKISLWLGNSIYDTAAVKVGEITVTSDEVGTVVTKQISPISVPSGKKLWIGNENDTGAFAYAPISTGQGSTYGAFYVLMGKLEARQNYQTTHILCINWGFIG